MAAKPKKRFYITTTLPYVNAPPHIGFAMEIVEADMIARYERLLGKEVFFNTGTDEHGLKIYRKALEEKMSPQRYVNKYAAKFKKLKKVLNLSYTHFIRTTDKHHLRAAQDFWRRCEASGDIYKKVYQGKYCVGCELQKTDSELKNGYCPIHPNQDLEIIEEENYFFRFSKYSKRLLALYRKRPNFVLPQFRFNEIKRFVERGLRDFSISRLKEKMVWGVSVPGDDKHVMYVWFDALVNYISVLGWPENEKKFKNFWPGIQVAGKDNLRQQSAMWQTMLMSAKLPNSQRILIHGFITSGGAKMSKSRGNVIDPFQVIKRYGTDAVRYYLLRGIPSDEDGEFTYEKFEEKYTADLANGLGNFTARVLALGSKLKAIQESKVDRKISKLIKETRGNFEKHLNEFRLHEAVGIVWELISFGDSYIHNKKPWQASPSKRGAIIYNLIVILDNVASLIWPIMPETSDKITKSIKWVSADKVKVKRIRPLFPRLDKVSNG